MRIPIPKYNYDVSKLFKCILIVFAFACLFSAGSTSAQSMADLGGVSIESMHGAATEPNDEWTIRMLKSFLGERFVNAPFKAVGAPETIAGGIIFLINAALFVLGTAFLSYQVVMTVVKGATDGSAVIMADTKGSMLPIRTGAGIFAMLPVFGGFSLAQAIMIFCATLGVGLGNMTKDAIVDRTVGMQAITPNIESLQNGGGNMAGEIRLVTDNLFFSNLCVAVRNEYAKTLGHNGANNQIKITEQRYPNGRTLNFGPCGEMTMQRRAGHKERLADDFLAFRLGSVDYDAIRAAAYFAADEQLDVVQSETKELAEKLVKDAIVATSTMSSGYALVPQEMINRAVETKEALDQIGNDAHWALTVGLGESRKGKLSAITPEVEATLRQQGWSTLGAWSPTLSAVSAAIADAQTAWQFEWNAGPELTRVQTELQTMANAAGSAYASSSQAGRGDKQFDILFTFLRDWQINVPQQHGAKAMICEGWGSSETGDCSVGQTIIEFVIKGTTSGSGGGGSIDIIYTSKQLGDFLLTFGTTILVTGPFVKAIGVATGLAAMFIPGIGTGTGAVVAAASAAMSSDTLKTLGYLSFAFGGFLAIYIPFLPTLIWFSALMKWVCSFAEKIVMAQFWAFSHLQTKGEEFAEGRAAQGYAHLMDVLLRPALMVLGLVFANGLVKILGTFFQQSLFFPAMSNVAGNSIVGAGSIIFIILIYAITAFAIVQSVHQWLVSDMPEKVVGWLGATAENSHHLLLGAAAGAAMRGFRGPGGGGGAAPTPSAGGSGAAMKVARVATKT